MRTNIDLDQGLVEEALRLAKVRTKKEVVHLALREFVKNRSRLDVRELKGQVKISEDYDHKALRAGS